MSEADIWPDDSTSAIQHTAIYTRLTTATLDA